MGTKKRERGKARQKRSKPSRPLFGLVPTLVATLFGAGALVLASWMIEAVPDLYYRSVQEDQALEWATFLAFMAASVLFALAGRPERHHPLGLLSC